jgi:hypothetical protein
MPFVAECNFCRLIYRGVPEDRIGSSIECSGCHSSFTLAPVSDPEAVLGRVRRVLTLAQQQAEESAAPLATAIEAATARQDARSSRLVENLAGEAEAPAPSAPLTNYPGLASFLLGCFAFAAASVLHMGVLTLGLGLLGVLIGLLGLLISLLIRCNPTLPVAGLAVSLPAMLVPLIVPDWLGLSPLRQRPTPAYQGEALVSLNNRGGARRVAKSETLWADASQDALLHGDVRLRIRWAMVGPVEFEPVKDQTAPAVFGLMIGLRLTNAGIARKIAYTCWANGDPAQGQPVLRDDQGKTYSVKTFGSGGVVKGRAKNSTIAPGKFVDDVLIFEPPPKNIAYLRLQLPAAVVGAEGQLRMEIPKKMIVFR